MLEVEGNVLPKFDKVAPMFILLYILLLTVSRLRHQNDLVAKRPIKPVHLEVGSAIIQIIASAQKGWLFGEKITMYPNKNSMWWGFPCNPCLIKQWVVPLVKGLIWVQRYKLMAQFLCWSLRVLRVASHYKLSDRWDATWPSLVFLIQTSHQIL